MNGKQACSHKNGYTSFDTDITELLEEGENLITVRVDHRSPNSRWYSGAGIYRNVYLCRYPREHILNDGIYVSADDKGNVSVTVETARSESEKTDGISVRIFICDGDTVLAEK